MPVKPILPALTEARSPAWRPMPYPGTALFQRMQAEGRTDLEFSEQTGCVLDWTQGLLEAVLAEVPSCLIPVADPLSATQQAALLEPVQAAQGVLPERCAKGTREGGVGC